MKLVMLALITVALALAAPAARALDFKSVGAAPAVIYDAPSERGRRVYVAPRGMPVEIVLTYGEWTKVRDASGDLFWIESKALAPKRNVVIAVASAKVRASADDAAPVLFAADKSVLFELAEPLASGWVKIKHRDGQSGYV